MLHGYRYQISVVATVGLFLLALLIPTRASFGQARQVSLKELTRTATAVVVGTTTITRSYWNEAKTQIFTDVTIRVDDQVKGEAASETIITIPGGRVGNTLYEVSDMPVFADDEEVLVFVWQHPSGLQLVSGGSLGKMTIMHDERLNRKVVRGAQSLFQTIANKAGSQDPAPGEILLEDLLVELRRMAGE